VPKVTEVPSPPFWHFCHPADITLYEKFGYEIDGTHRRFAFRSGEYVDAYSMARIKSPAPA
jgi:RimJ/RimL family protein N-acetyltransferase